MEIFTRLSLSWKLSFKIYAAVSWHWDISIMSSIIATCSQPGKLINNYCLWKYKTILFFRHYSTGGKPTIYSERRILGYSADEMFNVISQVEHYNKFVPWCKKSQVISKGHSSSKAKLIIGFPPVISESYTSHITLIRPNLVAAVCTDMKLFKVLKTVWKLDDNKKYPGVINSCTLDFAVKFEFTRSLHSSLSRYFFDDVIKANVEAFLVEAERRYGPSRIPQQHPQIIASKTWSRCCIHCLYLLSLWLNHT